MVGIYKNQSLALRDCLLLVIFSLCIRLVAISVIGSFLTSDSFYWFADPFEPYQDYEMLYLRWARAFWTGGWIPYSTGNVDPLLDFYVYPPLFLYLISIFNLPPFDFAFIPILISDILIVIPVYLITLHLINRKYALPVSIFYILSPLNVFYNGVLWLNTSPSTFFMMLALYFVIVQKKHTFSITFITLAMMTKQSIIFIIMPYFIYLIMKLKSQSWKYLTLFFILCFLLSIPYIIVDPYVYLHRLNVSPMPYWSTEVELPIPTAPVRFTHTLLILGLNELILSLFAIGYHTQLWFYLFIALVLFWTAKIMRKQDTGFELLFTCLVFGLVSHMFLPRGIYKYYLTALTPLLIIILNSISVKTSNDSKSQCLNYRPMIFFFVLSSFILLAPRLTYHLVMFGILVFLIMVRQRRSERKLTNRNHIMSSVTT